MRSFRRGAGLMAVLLAACAPTDKGTGAWQQEQGYRWRELGADGIRKLGKKNHVMYDIKHVFPSTASDGRL